MTQTLNVLYRDAAQEFARRVVASLGDRVDSVVLYGSSARGEARKYSDIDVLVVAPNPRDIKEELSQLRSDLVYEHSFDFAISLVYLGREDLHRLVEHGSPFIRNVIAEGVPLYDNGTFRRIRQAVPAASR